MLTPSIEPKDSIKNDNNNLMARLLNPDEVIINTSKRAKLLQSACSLFGLKSKPSLSKEESEIINRILTLKNDTLLDLNNFAKCNLFINGFFFHVPTKVLSTNKYDKKIEDKYKTIEIRYNVSQNPTLISEIQIHDFQTNETYHIYAKDTTSSGIRIPYYIGYADGKEIIAIIKPFFEQNGNYFNIVGITEEWRGPIIWKYTVMEDGIPKEKSEKHFNQFQYARDSSMVGLNEFLKETIRDLSPKYYLNGHELDKDTWDNLYNILSHNKEYQKRVINPKDL